MKKFNLQYTLKIQDKDYNTIIISSLGEDAIGNNYYMNNGRFNNKLKDNIFAPTVEINIDKQNTNAGNEATITIYNLGDKLRKSLFKSKVSLFNNRTITIEAGYSDYTSTIYKGNIDYCCSEKRNENILTEIHCNNSHIVNESNINMCVSGDDNILDLLLKNIKNLEIGEITPEAKDLFRQSSRGRTYSGNIYKIINENNEKYEIYEDDGKIYIMGVNQVLRQNNLVLNNESGLLNTPKDYGNFIELQTAFEPMAKLNQKIILESVLMPEYNGRYKTIGFNHNLVISKIGGTSEGTTNWKLLMLEERKQ